MISLPGALRPRAAQIRALVLDVDGVLTDGTLVYGPDGEAQKTFDVKDGLGVRLLSLASVEVAVITARQSAALHARLHDLHIERALVGRRDKLAALEELASAMHVDLQHIAYAGDDLLDVPALERAGISIAPADAHSYVRDRVSWVTHAGGGRGAVREIADDLLEARGDLDGVIARLLGEGR